MSFQSYEFKILTLQNPEFQDFLARFKATKWRLGRRMIVGLHSSCRETGSKAGGSAVLNSWGGEGRWKHRAASWTRQMIGGGRTVIWWLTNGSCR